MFYLLLAVLSRPLSARHPPFSTSPRIAFGSINFDDSESLKKYKKLQSIDPTTVSDSDTCMEIITPMPPPVTCSSPRPASAKPNSPTKNTVSPTCFRPMSACKKGKGDSCIPQRNKSVSISYDSSPSILETPFELRSPFTISKSPRLQNFEQHLQSNAFNSARKHTEDIHDSFPSTRTKDISCQLNSYIPIRPASPMKASTNSPRLKFIL